MQITWGRAPGDSARSDDKAPTSPSLRTALLSEWRVNRAEKVKEQVAPPAACFAPCGLVVSQHRPWAFSAPGENGSPPWGRPPPLPGAVHPQGARNQPRLGLLPHGRDVVGIGGALV